MTTLPDVPSASEDSHTIKGFGWHPDFPDYRDHVSDIEPEAYRRLRRLGLKSLPDEMDISGDMPLIYNQLQIGSCTANAIGACVQYQQIRQGLAEGANAPSRLFIYYGEREIEATINYDAGAMIRDGMKVVKNLGAPAETDWPYDVSKFTQRPPQEAYDNALKYQTLEYARVYRTSYYLRSHIFAHRPIVFGFTVFDSFWAATDTAPFLVSMPLDNDAIDGGHATVVVGYKKDPIYNYIYKVRNSWGAAWGDRGHFYMPESYLLDRGLSDDFWNIKKEEG